MKKYTISRGWYSVQTAEIVVETDEEALEIARNSPDVIWKDTGGDEELTYQIEYIED
jgi:hypothetical protein